MISRGYYIDVIEQQYFGNMARAQPERIMALLTDDAQLTAFHGADAPRLVRRRSESGVESFEHFLSALHHEFSLHYSHFTHVVDTELERAACTFRLEIRPRAVNSSLSVRIYRNCNFFQFRGNLICAITAYFAMPSADADPWSPHP